jgi:P4 family phage/plasmid primase-like protien
MTLLEAALALHDAGLCVLPAAEDGSKRPAVEWRRYQQERPDVDDLTAWFGLGDRTGLGFVCGRVSGGLEMLELEGRALEAGALPKLTELVSEAGLSDLWDRVVKGYVVASPSGGLHFHYRVPPALFWVPGNTKLAAQADNVTLAETRGEGGWVVTAPSHGRVHPTNKPWQVIAGSPATIPTITEEERADLHRVFRSLDERAVPEPVASSPFHQPRMGAGDGVSPGDDWSARTDWPEILEPEGWRQVFTKGGVTYWRRPGKAHGISATTGFGEGSWLYVFTSSTAFEPERTYTKFGALAVLGHGGDHQAAAKALQAAGFGKRTEVVQMPVARVSSSVPTAHGAAALADPAPVSEPVPLLQGFGLTDTGNARLLVAQYGNRLRYVPERGTWLRWTGHRWAPDDAGEHVERAKDTFMTALEVATEQATRQHYNRALSRKGIEAALALARSDPAIVAPADRLDSLPDLLCTPGGVVDLRTGEIRPANPEELHTRSTLVTPDPGHPVPRWAAFLAETYGGNPELIAYVQRLAGYSATGRHDSHVLPFLYGASGQNGKSVLTKVIGAVLGGYAGSAPGTFLTVGPAQHETEIARLAGLRFVICSEVEQTARFAEAKVKMLTGGDRITARFMRRDHFEFDPTAKLWLMANHRPQVSAGGNSFWRRLRLINHPHQVPLERRIEGLDDLMIAEEGPGILAWILAGARAYYAGGLQDPALVLAATAEYAEAEDDLGRFVSERLILAEGEARSQVLCPTTVLTAAYTSWCHDEGVEPVSLKRLGTELRGRWGVEPHRSGGRRFYAGVTVAASEDDPTFHQPAPSRLPFN